MDNNLEQYYREQNIFTLTFFDPESALFCHIKRHFSLGSLCGYVEIPDDIYENDDHDLELDLNVHGGVTFLDVSDDIVTTQEFRYLVGFDCAHYDDITPKVNVPKSEGATYKDINFVINECKEMARQIRELQELY